MWILGCIAGQWKMSGRTSCMERTLPRAWPRGSAGADLEADRNEALGALRRAQVGALLAGWELHGLGLVEVLVGNQREQVAHEIQARGALIVPLDHMPGAL